MNKPHYQFVIRALAPSRNPMGYKRTLNHSIRSDSVKYFGWQQYVRACFFDLSQISRLEGNKFKAPFLLSKENAARMDCHMAFGDETHADPDNVWKGMADCLFENDRHVFGAFTYQHVTGQGSVGVTIWLLGGAEAERAGPLSAELLQQPCGPRTLPTAGLSRNEGGG